MLHCDVDGRESSKGCGKASLRARNEWSRRVREGDFGLSLSPTPALPLTPTRTFPLLRLVDMYPWCRSFAAAVRCVVVAFFALTCFLSFVISWFSLSLPRLPCCCRFSWGVSCGVRRSVRRLSAAVISVPLFVSGKGLFSLFRLCLFQRRKRLLMRPEAQRCCWQKRRR